MASWHQYMLTQAENRRLKAENKALQQELADLHEAHEALLSEGDTK